jgi:TIR domain
VIFISYASEDHPYTCAIYSALRKAGLSPWMDKPPKPFEADGIQVGQRWQNVLNVKLNEADLVVLILSPRSVRKRGYVQVEFRTALSLMNQMPDDQVFVLPIVSENCDIPSLRVGQIGLRDLQWEEVKIADIDAFVGRLLARIAGGAP